MKHAEFCRRGWFDRERCAVVWRDGVAPAGSQQWHTARCETPDANLMYARARALIEAPPNAVPFMFDTIPSIEERAMRYGFAMKELPASPGTEVDDE